MHTKATAKEWIGLAVLVLPCLLVAMDLTVLLLAVPYLTADLKPSPSEILWITDMYGFLIAGFLITMGTLGDRIGRRKLLMIGGAAFGAASIMAAFAPTTETLIAARALLGIAGATLAPSTLSLIRNMFHDESQRTMAIGIWVSCFSVGGTLGPVVGGLMLNHFWWGSVFLLAVPVMVVLLIAGPRLLPESFDPNAGKMDLLSVVLSLGAVLSSIYGIKKIAENGLSVDYPAFIALGLIMGVLFVRRQKKLDDPLIDISLFSAPGFSAALSINMLALFIAFGLFLAGTQYLQLVIGLDAMSAGLWMIPGGIAFITGSLITPKLIQHFKRSHILAASMTLASLGFAIIWCVADDYNVALYTIGGTIFCCGLSPVGTLSTDLVMSTAPPERAGAASAISETSFEFGGAIGLAVLGSFVLVVYRTAMEAGAPPGTIQAAMDTLAIAVTQDSAVAEAARAAHTHALKCLALVGAVMSLLIAGISLTLLKRAG